MPDSPTKPTAISMSFGSKLRPAQNAPSIEMGTPTHAFLHTRVDHSFSRIPPESKTAGLIRIVLESLQRGPHMVNGCETKEFRVGKHTHTNCPHT